MTCALANPAGTRLVVKGHCRRWADIADVAVFVIEDWLRGWPEPHQMSPGGVAEDASLMKRFSDLTGLRAAEISHFVISDSDGPTDLWVLGVLRREGEKHAETWHYTVRAVFEPEGDSFFRG